MGVDRATAFATLTSVTPLVFGPVTALLVATRFSPDLQGYYYAFGSFSAVPALLEVGLGQSILQHLSHQWAGLRFDEQGRIHGDAASVRRLATLARQTVTWFGVLAALTIVPLACGGAVVLATQPGVGVHWVAPWLCLCLCLAAAQVVTPFYYLLQGCNRVSDYWFYRWIQQVMNGLVLWTGIGLGARLWTVPIAAAAALIWSLVFLAGRQGRLVSFALRATRDRVLGWRADVWPLQWRIAVTWASTSFTMQVFVPVLFAVAGPASAGRLGLTLALGNVLTAAASSVVVTKGPRFGVLVAQRRFGELDALFRRATLACVAIGCTGGFLLWGGILAMSWAGVPLVTRVLPPLPAGMLMAGSVMTAVTTCLSTYLRAHKAEPLTVVLAASSLATLLAAGALGARWGEVGILAAYLGVLVCFQMPSALLVLGRCRRAWHTGGSLS